MSFLISTAHAADAAPQGPGMMANILMMLYLLQSSIS